MFSKPPRDTENNPAAPSGQNPAQNAGQNMGQNPGQAMRPPMPPQPGAGMPPAPPRPMGAMPPQMQQRPNVAPAPQQQRPQQPPVRPTAAPQAPTPAAPSALRNNAYSRASSPERGLPLKENDNGRLTVGQEIKLIGEIRSCDRLIVEGTVEATLSDSRALEVVETGIFRGTATVDVADINGVFDGELSVEGRLLVRANGQITGTVRYGELEIERGGRISGSLEEFSAPSSAMSSRNAANFDSE